MGASSFASVKTRRLGMFPLDLLHLMVVREPGGQDGLTGQAVAAVTLTRKRIREGWRSRRLFNCFVVRPSHARERPQPPLVRPRPPGVELRGRRDLLVGEPSGDPRDAVVDPSGI